MTHRIALKRQNLLSAFLILFGLAMALPAQAQNAPENFANLTEDLLPTVVNVSTTQAMPEVGPEQGPGQELPQFPPGSPFEDFFQEFFERHQNSPQQAPSRPASLGSGFVIDAENGYIVTNNHVIRDAEEIKIILQDDSTLDAELIGTDDKTDIAVLKVITDKKLVAAEWGDSDNARVGSWVVAIGNPFGLGGSVTAGIVSARQRDINAGPYDEFIQTDASINRGNSGGPMFNMDGEVIGVNTAIFSPSGGSVGIGFAVPSSLAEGVVNQLIKYGKTRRGWLGVRIQVVTDEIAESLGLDETHGALVASVSKDGPAEKAGIKAGDIILGFNDNKIDSMRNLPRIVAETEVGKSAEVEIWRNEKRQDLNVKLGELEEAEESGMLDMPGPDTELAPKVDDVAIEELNLSLAALTPHLRQAYGIDEDATGVVVTEVTQGSDASEKGLQEGELITEVDQEEVTSPEDVQKQLATAKKEDRKSVLLLLSRGGDLRFVALKIGK
ncbi:MAG: DegQ family serine endoprotease [Pseudomonadota bacterium]